MKDKAVPSTIRLGLWLGFVAFLLVVLVFHSRLSKIEFGEKGMVAEIENPDTTNRKIVNPDEASKLSPDEKKAADEDLSKRVSQLEQQAKANPQPAPVAGPASQNTSQLSDAGYQEPQPQPQPVALNLGGFWMGTGGYTFQVVQIGNYIGITAYYGGVQQAVATGRIFGPNFTIQGYNLMSQPGTLRLRVSPNQRQMSGTYQNNFTGQLLNVEMSR